MDQPTKKFYEDQIKACQATIAMNQGVIQFCQQMIEKGIFVAEGQKEGASDIPS